MVASSIVSIPIKVFGMYIIVIQRCLHQQGKREKDVESYPTSIHFSSIFQAMVFSPSVALCSIDPGNAPLYVSPVVCGYVNKVGITVIIGHNKSSKWRTTKEL